MRLFRTRLHAYAALVFLGCLVIVGVVILVLPRKGVTRANFEKIEIGMSVADVQRLLGRRPDFETRTVQGDVFWPHVKEGDRDCIFQRWSSPEATIIVVVDATGRVVYRFAFSDSSLVAKGNFWEAVWSWIMGLLGSDLIDCALRF
jgi:hypothetical protein